jgi:short-subunit dehydrogenase
LVTELGPPARGFAADLTNLAQVRELLGHADPVDILVACAGLDVSQDLADTSDEALEEAMRINLLAPAALARAALAPMKQRGAGHIVFIGSVAGLVATPINSSIYTATKWGLRGLGLALRQELHGTGIGVSTVFPAGVRDAGMFARTGVTLPWYAGTSSAQDVARAVVRAGSARGNSGCRRRAAGRCDQRRRAGPRRQTRPSGRPRWDTSSGA